MDGYAMSLMALEGVVENGRIRLRGDVVLPDRTTVYVVVPDVAATPPTGRPARVFSPRLADPRRAAELVKQVIEESPDAGQP
jgi:hypothetical protein